MIAILTHRISASGKSTLAREYVEQGYVEINRDILRERYFSCVYPQIPFCWKKWDWSWETCINEMQLSEIINNANLGNNIIISDTNLNPKTNDRLINQLKLVGYKVEHSYLDVSLEECLTRDSNRTNPVGEEVITRQYQNYLKLERI